MSCPPFILPPVPAPEYREEVSSPRLPRPLKISSPIMPSSPSRALSLEDSSDSLRLPSSPSLSTFSIRSTRLNRIKDIFRTHPHSPRDPSLLSSSPKKNSMDGAMDVDIVPDTPTRKPKAEPKALIVKTSPEFGALLESMVQGIATDFVSGARQMASGALSSLATLIELAAATADNAEDLFAVTTSAAKQMALARPAMSAAVQACVLRALAGIEKTWKTEMEEGDKSPTDLSRISSYVVQEFLNERHEAGKNLGKSFTYWVKMLGLEARSADDRQNKPIRILTLSNSGTIYTAILTLLVHVPTTLIHLTILESRPGFEGASLATNLLGALAEADPQAQSRLHIRVAPDCAVASVAREVDIVLLGADRITSTGDVSNKMGSLATVVCARQLQPNAKIAVLSDIDKIVAPNATHAPPERHDPSELTEAWSTWVKREYELGQGDIDIFGEWFEWVPKDYIDVYITEMGPLNVKEVAKHAVDIEQLEERFFG